LLPRTDFSGLSDGVWYRQATPEVIEQIIQSIIGNTVVILTHRLPEPAVLTANLEQLANIYERLCPVVCIYLFFKPSALKKNIYVTLTLI